MRLTCHHLLAMALASTLPACVVELRDLSPEEPARVCGEIAARIAQDKDFCDAFWDGVRMSQSIPSMGDVGGPLSLDATLTFSRTGEVTRLEVLELGLPMAARIEPAGIKVMRVIDESLRQVRIQPRDRRLRVHIDVYSDARGVEWGLGTCSMPP